MITAQKACSQREAVRLFCEGLCFCGSISQLYFENMRITGGRAKGRRISTLKGLDVRPTTDKVREALFQILTARHGVEWQDHQVLDLFAGSGSLGLEALSRGAEKAVFVDSSSRALDCIRKNLKSGGFDSPGTLLRADLKKTRAAWNRLKCLAPFGIVFADPPYNMGLGQDVLAFCARFPVVEPGGMLVVEEFGRVELPDRVSGDACTLELVDQRRYGQTALFFYESPGSG